MAEQSGAFAGRLKAIREAAGLSQYALARRSGLTKQALSRLELGERDPTWVTVQLLAAALGADFGEFADPNVRPPVPTEPAAANPRKAKPAGARQEAKGKAAAGLPRSA